MRSTCQACGCYLIPKSKCLHCECGIGYFNEQHPDQKMPIKWEAVMTEEEENKLKEITNEPSDAGSN